MNYFLTQAHEALGDLHHVPFRTHIPTVILHPVMNPHRIPLISWMCQAHCHLRAFSASVPFAYYVPAMPLLVSFPHLALSEYCCLSLGITLSEVSMLTHSAKQLPQEQPVSPGTGFVYLSIHLFSFFPKYSLHSYTCNRRLRNSFSAISL